MFRAYPDQIETPDFHGTLAESGSSEGFVLPLLELGVWSWVVYEAVSVHGQNIGRRVLKGRTLD